MKQHIIYHLSFSLSNFFISLINSSNLRNPSNPFLVVMSTKSALLISDPVVNFFSTNYLIAFQYSILLPNGTRTLTCTKNSPHFFFLPISPIFLSNLLFKFNPTFFKNIDSKYGLIVKNIK
ncbi:hypothetical protein LCGC14_2470080 [marine sediment metagenome]|uniref:Uncharacterized protein n=1 Tax=marine sediment metagenome TaxID=412755 RepID=A0A0F9BAJ9_9ZZZZ